jgi:hypothetical protein
MSPHRARMAWAKRCFGDIWSMPIETGGYAVTTQGSSRRRVFYGPNAARKAARDLEVRP